MVVRDNTVQKQIPCDRTRPIDDGFCNFRLQALSKAFIAFARNNGQHINVLYIISKNACILTLAILINGKTHAASYFLTFANLTA